MPESKTRHELASGALTPIESRRWQNIVPERKRIVMWGAADQARVNRYILAELGCEVVALVDDTPNMSSPFLDVPIFSGWSEFEPWLRSEEPGTLGFVIAIGNPYGHVRCRLHRLLLGAGLTPVTMVDPTARLCTSASFGSGLQVMPGAIVHSDAHVGLQCLINTRSLVEHDCLLEDGVEIGPGTVLAGRVRVGENSWVCTGATVRPRVEIGRNTIIGAGAVVVSDIPDGVIAVGVPARPMANRTTPSMEAESVSAPSPR